MNVIICMNFCGHTKIIIVVTHLIEGINNDKSVNSDSLILLDSGLQDFSSVKENFSLNKQRAIV